MKRRLEDEDDEGSLVPWYQLSREKTGETGEWAEREVMRTTGDVDRTIRS